MTDASNISAIISLVATGLGAATAAGALKFILRLKTRKKEHESIVFDHDVSIGFGITAPTPTQKLSQPPRPSDIAKMQLARRLQEAKDERSTQRGTAKMYAWSAHLLTFGQYIIGGVLASSFVQQTLSANIIGLFGVLVLLSSLIKQQYRPDVRANAASFRAAQLQTLIRDTEDRITTLETKTGGEDNTEAILWLVGRISTLLNEIESVAISIADGSTAERAPVRKVANGR
jgi:hypothetical protein